MNESYEQEIDLKWLIYRVLRGWRTIVVWAIIIAAAAGVSGLALNLASAFDPEHVAEQEEIFETEHTSWVATGENYKAEIENLRDAIVKQKEYNEKSVLMQINPLREYNASYELYVDYDYQINPELSYQNTDLSNRILKAYATYMTNGEMYQYILNHLSYDIELRYFREIFSVNVDYSNNMISVSVRQDSAEKCQEILTLASEALNQKFNDVKVTIADHALVQLNGASYEAVNLELERSQKANVQYISDLEIALQETNEEYLEWKREPEPQRDYTVTEVVKGAIKMLILAGIIGAVVVAVVIAFSALLSGKLLNPEDIKHRFGIRLIGQLPQARVKKPFAFVSRWFAAFGGITMKPEDEETMARMIGASVKSELSAGEESRSYRKIAFVGTVAEEEIKKLLEMMKADAAYTVSVASDILGNAASVETVAQADCVVLVEKQEVSKLAEIQKETEALRAWNKPIIGAVLLNADAVM